MLGDSLFLKIHVHQTLCYSLNLFHIKYTEFSAKISPIVESRHLLGSVLSEPKHVGVAGGEDVTPHFIPEWNSWHLHCSENRQYVSQQSLLNLDPDLQNKCEMKEAST